MASTALTPRKRSAPAPEAEPRTTTLLDLVTALVDTGAGDREVVASVFRFLQSGRVRLVGQVIGEDLHHFPPRRNATERAPRSPESARRTRRGARGRARQR